ncbi:hypothetical protein [Streptomyces sp. SAI-126]|uniref:hypothetical protein n=1 Tax=Streptomyces sp. SAI-126 TaxID=3377732 RepID=UPI003C7CCF80
MPAGLLGTYWLLVGSRTADRCGWCQPEQVAEAQWAMASDQDDRRAVHAGMPGPRCRTPLVSPRWAAGVRTVILAITAAVIAAGTWVTLDQAGG